MYDLKKKKEQEKYVWKNEMSLCIVKVYNCTGKNISKNKLSVKPISSVIVSHLYKYCKKKTIVWTYHISLFFIFVCFGNFSISAAHIHCLNDQNAYCVANSCDMCAYKSGNNKKFLFQHLYRIIFNNESKINIFLSIDDFILKFDAALAFYIKSNFFLVDVQYF